MIKIFKELNFSRQGLLNSNGTLYRCAVRHSSVQLAMSYLIDLYNGI